MPDLLRYQLRDGPHAGEPTSERGEIERLARACRAAACHTGSGSTVIETRFNVVRSGLPDPVSTTRRLRDYLPPVDHRDRPMEGEAPGSPRHTVFGGPLDGDAPGRVGAVS